MCELLGLSSNVRATVNVSLPKLAEHGRIYGTYNDGWGIGYYEGLDVRLTKDSAAVGDSEWIQFIANHNLRSHLVIAHTRKATRGTQSYPNAQPFVRELAGRAHLFAHNGDLPGIFKSNAFHADRFNPIGETDSELAFCVLLDEMAAIWSVRVQCRRSARDLWSCRRLPASSGIWVPRIFCIPMAICLSLTDTDGSMPKPAG
jgi:predicted glutamine amidotransferase